MTIVSYNDLNIADSWKQVMEITGIELKFESKDSLLARIWYGIEFLLFDIAC
jgi:hypothetical protein